MRAPIQFTLNGRSVSVDTDGDRTLLWVLRADLGLTGTKYGCGVGLCGSCTVTVDGRAVRSCRTTLAEVRGRAVRTIEGLADGDDLHPLQTAFVEHGAYQCGYCTSGMIMNAVGLLGRTPHPTREQIVAAMGGNLCRCGAHPRILDAITAAAERNGGDRD